MAGAGFLGSTPDGSARLDDIHNPADAAFNANGWGISRGGVYSQALFDSGSNWGFGAQVARELTQLNGVAAFRDRQGCNGAGATRTIPLIHRLSTVKKWSPGVFVWEIAMAWANNTVGGVDSGFMLCDVFAARPVQAAANGIEVYNDAGVLKLLTRGNGNAETVDLSAIVPAAQLVEFHLFRFELHNSVNGRPAKFRLSIDGVQVLERQWTGAYALPDGAGIGQGLRLFAAVGMFHAVEYIYYRDVHYFCGPSDSAGVL